jgi:hypothetical protein
MPEQAPRARKIAAANAPVTTLWVVFMLLKVFIAGTSFCDAGRDSPTVYAGIHSIFAKDVLF